MEISINQLADFFGSTPSVKRRILKQQINPSKVRVNWYQLSKSRIRKSLALKGDLTPILDGLSILKNRIPKNKREESDKIVSIAALERYVNMNISTMLKNIDYKQIQANQKITKIHGINVIVAPDVVFKGFYNGVEVLGAIKIHVVKGKPFDIQKSKIVASLIYSYLRSEVADGSVQVLPELCLCIDIFGDRIVSATGVDISTHKDIEQVCEEIKELWNEALN